MGVVIPPGFAQVAHHYRLIGDPEDIVITYGIAVTGGVDQGAVDDIDEAWKTNMADRTPDAYNLDHTMVYVGNDPPPGPSLQSSGSVAGGTYGTASDALPQNCAILVKKLTASGGRANKGRFYLPPPPEGLVNPLGVIDAGAVGDIQTNCTAFYTALLGVVAVDSLVVLHSEGSPATTPTEISAFLVESVMATQRRRLRR